VVLLAGVLLAGFLPPPSPADSARQIQRIYLSNLTGIRVGVLLAMIGCTLFTPFVCAMSVQMKRVEGRYSPLAYVQLLCGLINFVLGLIPLMLIEVAAFRAGRSADLIQIMNDAAWLMFIGVIFPGCLELLVIGVCAFKDRDSRVFPRWYGWFGVWMPLVFVGDLLIYFFKRGPFAYDGAISFWWALALVSVWIVTTFVAMRTAILQHGAQEARAG
jgi:hypothetical protein